MNFDNLKKNVSEKDKLFLEMFKSKYNPKKNALCELIELKKDIPVSFIINTYFLINELIPLAAKYKKFKIIEYLESVKIKLHALGKGVDIEFESDIYDYMLHVYLCFHEIWAMGNYGLNINLKRYEKHLAKEMKA